jgi:hypothetical protein
LAVQAAAHYLTEYSLMSVPAIEGTLVVELMNEGPTQLRPTPQQMGARSRAAFVQVLRERNAVRIVVDSVKVLDRCSTIQVLGDDVGGENGIDLPSYRPRVVSTLLIGSYRVRQTVLGQHALNGHRVVPVCPESISPQSNRNAFRE